MKKLRLLALILFVALTFSSCAPGTAVNSDDTTKASETTAQNNEISNGMAQLYRERDDKLPDLDFGGETIRFLTLQNREWITGNVYDDEIWVDEITSEPLNDAIYNRNMYVMERLNCEIENELAFAEDISQKIIKTFSADEDVYQVIGFEAAPALNYSLDGYFYDLTDLETDYIEFDAPWWSGQFFDAVSADGEVFALAGALSLSMTRSIHVTYFNKRIAEDQKVEDLYTVVNDGRWTIDYQTELTSSMYDDVNGDDNRDREDEYGYASPFYWSLDAYWSAFDIDILSRNGEGMFELSLNVEKAYDGFNKIMALTYGNGAYYEEKNNETLDETVIDGMFTSGRVFMTTQKLAAAENAGYRNMQDDYGILPMPKFDENQKEYYSMPYEIFQTYSIPKTAENPEMVTAVLEALCAETWRKIIPTYAEIVLKGKYLNDPQSRTMFDKIINNTKVDAGIMYCRRIGDVGAALYRYPIWFNEPDNFSSNLQSIRRKSKLLINDLNRLLFES